jgi:uncharacterized membrane protein YebE (DUF533 family)
MLITIATFGLLAYRAYKQHKRDQAAIAQHTAAART